MTLLAFGNGANDVITAFAAGGGDRDSIYLSLGSILGSCFFITTIVSSLIILVSSSDISMDKGKFNSNIVMMIICIVLLLASSFVGYLHWIFSLSFLLIYVW